MPTAPATTRQERTATGTPSTKARGQSWTLRPRSTSIDASVGPSLASEMPAAAIGRGGHVGAGANGVRAGVGFGATPAEARGADDAAGNVVITGVGATSVSVDV